MCTVLLPPGVNAIAVDKYIMSISCRRFGTRGPRNVGKEVQKLRHGRPETSVMSHHYSLRDIPEERGSHPLRGGSLKTTLSAEIADELGLCRLCHARGHTH
jgi:hypothetical protein